MKFKKASPHSLTTHRRCTISGNRSLHYWFLAIILAGSFVGPAFGSVLAPILSVATLSFSSVKQSTDAAAANTAFKAVDGSPGTCSLTADLPGSWWQADLGRPYLLERVEIVNRSAPNDAELAGLALRLFNMDDQLVFQTTLSNPGSGGTLSVAFPSGTKARSLWIGLPGTQTNGAGNCRVGLAEVRLIGVPNIPYGPEPVPSVVATNAVRVWQSSEYGGIPRQLRHRRRHGQFHPYGKRD